MRESYRHKKRISIIVSMMLVTALTHMINIERYLQGAPFNLFKSYFSDVVLPFSFYFLLCASEHTIPIFKRWEVKWAVMILLPSIAELCQYFGIPVLGSTFDPMDFLAYAIGATLAAIVDTQVFPRLFGFWMLEKTEIQEAL